MIGGATKLICNVIENKENVWEGVGIAALTGAASGALAATGVGLVGQIVGGAAIAMAGNAAQQGIDIATGKRMNLVREICLLMGLLVPYVDSRADQVQVKATLKPQ